MVRRNGHILSLIQIFPRLLYSPSQKAISFSELYARFRSFQIIAMIVSYKNYQYKFTIFHFIFQFFLIFLYCKGCLSSSYKNKLFPFYFDNRNINILQTLPKTPL